MARVTINANRRVVGVFRLERDASADARGKPGITSFGADVDDKVEVGDYINATGVVLSAPPVAVLKTTEGRDWIGQGVQVFNRYIRGERQGWRAQLGFPNHGPSLNASDKWWWSQCALLYLIANDDYLKSSSRADRNSAMEHIVKQLRDDNSAAYFRFLSSATARTSWSGANVASGQPLYSDLFTGTTARDPDGAFNRVSTLNIPANFDASIPGMIRS